MGKNKMEFNQDIFLDLIYYIRQNQKIPSVDYIKKHYDLSDRTANAYRFTVSNQIDLKRLLTNVEKQTRDTTAEKKIMLHEIKILEKRNDGLQARLDFLEAVDIWDTYESSKLIIPTPNKKEEFTAISTLSDTHIDEIVEPSTVNYLNEYNPTIAEERVKRYFTRLLFVVNRYRTSGLKIKHLVLGILGDMISGYIHEELMENNSMSPTEATIFAQNLIINGIKFLSENGEFDSIKVIMTRGNHGRNSKKKKYSTGYKNSYEWMMYTQIQKAFKEILKGYNNVEFRIPTSEYAYADIYHTVNSFSHGDHFNYRGGVGGVMVPMMNWLYKQNKVIPADKRWIGHWHQYVSLPNGNINGSGIGYNAFAMGVNAQPEVPKMQFQLVSSIKGYTANEPIYLLDF